LYTGSDVKTLDVEMAFVHWWGGKTLDVEMAFVHWW